MGILLALSTFLASIVLLACVTASPDISAPNDTSVPTVTSPDLSPTAVSVTLQPESPLAVATPQPTISLSTPIPIASPQPTIPLSIPNRSLTSEESSSLQASINEAGQTVELINQCAAENGQGPPAPNDAIETQIQWYSNAVIEFRECIASKLANVDFSGDN